MTKHSKQYTADGDKTKVLDILDTSTIDAIYPFSMEEKNDYMMLGDNYVRVLAIVDYPKVAYGNWLSDLKTKKGNITFIQYIKGISASKMLDYYNKSIKNKQAEFEKTLDPLKQRKIQKQIEAAELQLDKFLGNETTYIYQYTYINIQGKSLEELNAVTDSVKNTLTRLQLVPLLPTGAQFQAFWSSIPTLENLLAPYTEQQSNTEVAASMFPFADSEMLTLNPRSDVEGVNIDTGSLIAIDLLNRNTSLNQNVVVIGTSGVGKTTYFKQKILRYIAQGIRVFIIDPENEYSNLVLKFNGTVVNLSSNSTTKINPLEIFSIHILDEEDGTEQIVNMEILLRDKIQRVLALFQVIKPDLSAVEKAILDRVIMTCYEDKGITKKEFAELKSEDYPILYDVFLVLGKLKETDYDRFKRVEDFYYILESYVIGSRTLFNGITNIDLTSNLVSFNLKPLQNEKDVQGAAYLNVFSFLWDEITKNKAELVKLFVDEFHFLTQNPDAASFFYQAYKRFRKYQAGAIAGTQQIQDVIDGQLEGGRNVGEAIVGNSFTKVFFGLDNKGVKDIVEKLSLNLSEREMKLLSNRKQAEAIIIHGVQRAFMRVELLEEELRMIDEQAYEKKYKRKATDPLDYEKLIRLSTLELNEINNYNVIFE